MFRRWCVPLAGATILASLIFAAGTAAKAAKGSHAPAAQRSRPREPVFRPAGHMTLPFAARGSIRNRVGSTNWSGYAVGGGSYTSVSASWAEPIGICASDYAYSGLWVGMDGYNSSTVEQIGTEVDCSAQGPNYYAWYEMYPSHPVHLPETVHPGDYFTGSVTFNGGGSFTLELSDTTSGWSHTVNASLSGAARSSAEVIVEAPSSTGGVLPLTNFGTASIAGATVNGTAMGDLDPTRIVMVDSSGGEKDTISSLSGGENFSATWLRGG